LAGIRERNEERAELRRELADLIETRRRSQPRLNVMRQDVQGPKVFQARTDHGVNVDARSAMKFTQGKQSSVEVAPAAFRSAFGWIGLQNRF
jgi:hypothetical protein